MKRDISNIDTAQVFLCFMALVGDIEKTALACDLDPIVVEKLAEEFSWTDKIRRVSIQSKSGKPGDHEKAMNRALNFAQSHLFRSLVQRVLESLANKDGAELIACMASVKAGQVTLSAKLFSDLAAAAEKAHHLSYLALGDEVAGREAGATGKDDDLSIESLHASIICALNHPASAGAELKMIEESIEDLVKTAIPKKP